ncbi:MAG: 4-hydroxy-tetrahydrodipicolinate synthase [Bacteroidales bacterium]|jgi:4-hydroxy-tetrahydrodipicolinate synthase|nr:4-hydroxy-tetrahydrodipicolinate synthase [Bacteroidales bacterium]
MKQLTGCGTALVTPFKADGSVDYAAYAETVKRQVAAGIHFLVPLGTTAETPCLSDEEKVELLKITREHAQGLPLVVGAGTNSLAGTLRNMALLEPYGVDYFLVVAPYYNKPTQQGLYAYYKAVAAATEKSIILYNVPGRTGVNITAETTLALANEVENIVAIKEASGNYAQISRIIKDKPEGFSVLSGNDDETLSLMATGAQGVISVASNVAPAQMVALTEALLKDDMPAARSLHYQLMSLFKNCFVESNPIPAKAAMSLLGLMENELRAPLTPATDSTIELMKKTLAEL